MNADRASLLPRSVQPLRVQTRDLQLMQVPSFSSSITEGIWSHGSSCEQFIAREDLAQRADFKSQEKLKPEVPGYRCEGGGIVVYDIRAQVYGETSFVCADSPTDGSRDTPCRKRSLDSAQDSDKRRFAAMPCYTPYPSFRTEFLLAAPPDSLRFDSRFESGNLKRAIRMRENEYNLLLQEDTGTNGHTQWYYFAVFNSLAITCKFSILNLYKSGSLYEEGMLPTVFSIKKQQKEGIGWHHAGSKVSYFESPSDFSRTGKSYCLSFTYQFEYENDTVYFAHSVPYTYQELCKWLEKLKSSHPSILRVNSMCQTLAGNVCEMMTITEDVGSYRSFESEAMEWHMASPTRKAMKTKAEQLNPHQGKKGIVLTARVHPGETVGSHMLRGAVEFLLSDASAAVMLRKHFVFRVVPMLNPDGVRYGNYRCSVLGVDLNRRWLIPSKVLHPTIFYTKRMMQVFADEHSIAFYCDFHGHSCKRNVFMYGCSRPSTNFEYRKNNVEAKVLPLLLAHTNKLISWRDCHFHMEKSKEATARSVVCTEFNIMESYTIEASFYGPSDIESFADSGRTDCQMTVADYEQIGASLVETSVVFTTEERYAEALALVRDLMISMKQNSDLESECSDSPGLSHTALRAEDEEQRLWESLIALDTIDDDYEPSGESDSESSSESEKNERVRSRKQSRRQSKASPRVDPKASIEGIAREMIEFSRLAQSRTIRSERQTPSKSPLISVFRSERRKTMKRRIASPVLHSRRNRETIDDVVTTEPSETCDFVAHKPLEVRGHTRFHKSQSRTKRSLARPKSLRKHMDCGKGNMIESMRRALKKGTIKPLLCSPISPVLGNLVIDNTRTSIKRLKMSCKSKTPDV